MKITEKPIFLSLLSVNSLVFLYLTSHIVFLLILGNSFAFSSDEGGYLYTFKNLYGSQDDPTPQYGSGWLATPKWFLQMVYIPAKLFSIFGIPDYFAIRLLSVIIATFCVWLILQFNFRHNENKTFGKLVVVGGFSIPSIFLWTSLGLREVFILFGLVLFLNGLHILLKEGISKPPILFIFFGSLVLLCTKAYLWIILELSIIILCLILFALRNSHWKQIVMGLIVSGGLVPALIFTLSTSTIAWSFILQANIQTIGSRSGDSIAQVIIDIPTTAASQKPTTAASQKTLTFHGDYSLILLHDYLKANPDAFFTKLLRIFGAERAILRIWDSKVESGLASESGKVGNTEIGLNTHQLQPGSISNPLSMIRPAFLFLFGPIPFFGEPGFAASMASFESPFWWLLMILVLMSLTRSPMSETFNNPFILFSLIFFAGLVGFSSIVEVNLGTSFRHRSIVLPVLLFFFLELKSGAKKRLLVN